MAFIKAKKTAWNTERGMALLYEDDPKNGVIIPIDALPPLGAHARTVHRRRAGEQGPDDEDLRLALRRLALKRSAFAVETMRSRYRRQPSCSSSIRRRRERAVRRPGQGRSARLVHHRPQQAQLATSLFLSSKLDAFASLRRGGVAVKPCKGFGSLPTARGPHSCFRFEQTLAG